MPQELENSTLTGPSSSASKIAVKKALAPRVMESPKVGNLRLVLRRPAAIKSVGSTAATANTTSPKWVNCNELSCFVLRGN
mmetsp:Transcript_7221/g.11005  ORF Transcript_7221/g.11005 Transcript_7221/m.11005 type:complete len:81 (+) Transcript_7221:590-832(+)